MSYYLDLDNHIIDKVKVVLALSNYPTEKELDHATSDLTAKKDFNALKVELDKLDVNKMVNVSN